MPNCQFCSHELLEPIGRYCTNCQKEIPESIRISDATSTYSIEHPTLSESERIKSIAIRLQRESQVGNVSVPDREIILIEEQGASRKIGTIRSISGTLLLTNKRLVFIHGDKVFFQDKGSPSPGLGGDTMPTIYFSEIYDASEIPQDIWLSTSGSISFSLEDIDSATSEKRLLHKPTLKVVSNATDNRQPSIAEFQEQITGKRDCQLDEWAPLILKVKSGELNDKIDLALRLTNLYPSVQTLEGKVFYILGDLQRKNAYEISSQIEEKFNEHVSLQDVEIVCLNLSKQGWIDEMFRDYSLPLLYCRNSPLVEVTHPIQRKA